MVACGLAASLAAVPAPHPPLPRLILAPKQTHRCRSGHPWVFRSEIERWEGDPEDGGVVEVVERTGKIVGRGFHSARSQIAVRLLTRGDAVLDEALLRRRLRAAIAWRDQAMAGRPCRRLVSSEGDLLPGLIVDQYHDRLVVQATTVGMDRRLDWWCAALTEELHPLQIVERNDVPVRRLEGLDEHVGVRSGPADTRLLARCGKVDLAVDLLDPHKTGAYLDQQVNHERIVGWLPKEGASVLDCCCHLGGFALHALLAGATRVVAVDTAPAAIAGCRAAAERLAVGDRLETEVADAFAWLRAAGVEKQRFDLAVLDPPAFARSREAVKGALSGYRDLHVHALRLLAPGGRLATFTCSHHITAGDFLAMVVEAAAQAGRTLRLDEVLGAAPDHPVLPAVPESEYLRGWVLTVLDG